MVFSTHNFDGVRRYFRARLGSGTEADPFSLGVGIVPDTGALTDRSGSISIAAQSQQLAAANTSRRYLFVQNPIAASETLRVNIDAAAGTTNSFELAPGGILEYSSPFFVPTGPVNVVAATQGHAFVAKEA